MSAGCVAESLHVVEVTDICGHDHVLRDVTLAEAHGRIGSFHPVKVDGRWGHLRFVSPASCDVKFEAAS